MTPASVFCGIRFLSGGPPSPRIANINGIGSVVGDGFLTLHRNPFADARDPLSFLTGRPADRGLARRCGRVSQSRQRIQSHLGAALKRGQSSLPAGRFITLISTVAGPIRLRVTIS